MHPHTNDKGKGLYCSLCVNKASILKKKKSQGRGLGEAWKVGSVSGQVCTLRPLLLPSVCSVVPTWVLLGPRAGRIELPAPQPHSQAGC